MPNLRQSAQFKNGEGQCACGPNQSMHSTCSFFELALIL